MSSEVQIQFVIRNPIKGIDFGIQKGKGKDYETVETKRSKGRKLAFCFSIAVESKQGQPNFKGPFTQGPPASRFVYVDIGKYAGQTGTDHGARMKVPLAGITWDMIEQAWADGGYLEAQLPGEQTATVHPIDGWQVVSRT